ncbi:hypothetical protein Y032_0089g2226 [Ancylostoma ceylanicum]|uniref:Uncharacterized protein n=1 Tax=Ancylostoma ceylanicum TaxID=53326 RepID=A0A016TNU4_9BILA|nr:hypothetical protein Y032_0089g2226 [Ancylostoma ceylanicum]
MLNCIETILTQRSRIATDDFRNTTKLISLDAYAIPEPAFGELVGRSKTDLPAAPGTPPRPTDLVWPVVTQGHGFNRASVGQTSPVGLVWSPPQQRQD